METFIIDNKAHLGDYVAILILAYNRAIENNWIIKIYGNKFTEELFEIFDFHNLKYCGETTTNHTGNSISQIMPQYRRGPLRWNQAQVAFLNMKHMFRTEFNSNGKRIKEIKLPSIKIKPDSPKNDICYFQFDSRSIHPSQKRLFTQNEMKYIIETFSKNQIPVGIGGPNTKIYLQEYPFEICSSIKEIAHKMINCYSFTGIDSGLSHLAGALKVNTNIVLCAIPERHREELIEFYKIFYKTHCFTLKDLEEKTLSFKENINNKNETINIIENLNIKNKVIKFI